MKYIQHVFNNQEFSSGDDSDEGDKLLFTSEQKARLGVYVRAVSGTNNRLKLEMQAEINMLSGTHKFTPFETFEFDLNSVDDTFLTDEFSIASIKDARVYGEFLNGTSYSVDVFLLVG